MAKKKKAAKHTSLPPLSMETLQEVEKIAAYGRSRLLACCNFVGLILNEEAAQRILRTCAVSILDAQVKYYESLPNFQEEWVIAIRENSVNSVLGFFPSGFTDWADYFYKDLAYTTYDHLNPPKVKAKQPKAAQAIEIPTRKQIRDSYLKQFPGTKRLDICWAAGQHYSEFKRWLRNAVKDGSAPDRAFRALLTSGKTPAEYRKQPREKGCK